MPARARCGSSPPPPTRTVAARSPANRSSPRPSRVIGTDGVDALSMRALATRLGVVPGGAVPPRAQQGAAPRPRPRRGAGRGRLPGRSPPRLDRADQDARAPATHGPGEPPRHRRTAQDPRPPRAALPRPRRGVPRSATRGRPTRTGHRPGLRPGLRLHPRFRTQQPHLRQRAARPGHRDQKQTPRVPALTASRPLPHPGRPRRTRLAQQPRRTVHRRPQHPRRRTRHGATPTPARAAAGNLNADQDRAATQPTNPPTAPASPTPTPASTTAPATPRWPGYARLTHHPSPQHWSTDRHQRQPLAHFDNNVLSRGGGRFSGWGGRTRAGRAGAASFRRVGAGRPAPGRRLRPSAGSR